MNPPTPTFGQLLRTWRSQQRFTQLSLAQHAGVSARHLSYLENGRARPSRDMVLTLSEALDVPLPERNQMLLAAGLAPHYPQTELEEAVAKPVRAALEFMLLRHHPYPAFVVDAGWTVVMANDAYVGLGTWLGTGERPVARPDILHAEPPVRGSNPLVAAFEPGPIRDAIENFEEFSAHALSVMRRAAGSSPAARQTLQHLLAHAATRPAAESPPPMVLPLTIAAHGLRFSVFSTLTMLGSSPDAVLSSLRLETQFPADGRSDATIRELLG